MPDATAAEVKELTFWSHWAEEQPKRQFVEASIRDFDAKLRRSLVRSLGRGWPPKYSGACSVLDIRILSKSIHRSR